MLNFFAKVILMARTYLLLQTSCQQNTFHDWLKTEHMLKHESRCSHKPRWLLCCVYSVHEFKSWSTDIHSNKASGSIWWALISLYSCTCLISLFWPEVKTPVFPVFKYASLVNLCFVILCKYSSHEFTFSSIFRLAEKCRKEGRGNILDKVGTYEPP